MIMSLLPALAGECLMEVAAEIEIARPREIVWAAITDIERWTSMVTSIIGIKILSRPAHGLVGLKWEETRRMFGKQATETLWVTDAVEHEYYCSRAESHGSVYITRFSLRDLGDKTLLSISFSGESQTPLIKTVSFCMAPFIKSTVVNALHKDLGDIKAQIEKH
jgi:hypothetical protein